MLFLGCLFNKEEEEKILELSNKRVSNASNTYQWNLIEGLCIHTNVDIINVLPVGTYPKHYKKLVLDTKAWKFKNNPNNIEIGSPNLPFIKQYTRYNKTKNAINSSISRSEENKNIIIYSTYLPFLKAIYKLDKTINITLIVTDLPEYYDLSKVSYIRKIARKINNHYLYKYMTRIDSFVLLTKQMKNKLNVGERPYIVIEGISNTEDNYKINEISTKQESDKKIILYTGTLHYQFGIKTVLDSFSLINESNYELWICGSGEAADYIKQQTKIDNRIKFYGYVTKEEVAKLQQQATILINPRPNEGEYTKYSFPSKTMEYMASGKPVLMYKLDGIPDEYDNFLYYVEGTSIENLKDKIVEVCEKSDRELNEFGEKALNFVIKNKNSRVQAKKIFNLIVEKE